MVVVFWEKHPSHLYLNCIAFSTPHVRDEWQVFLLTYRVRRGGRDQREIWTRIGAQSQVSKQRSLWGSLAPSFRTVAEAPCPGSDRTQASIVHSLWWIWYTLYFVFNCVLHVLTISPMPSHSAEDRPEQSSHRMHLTLVRIQGVRSFKRTARISPSILLGFLILFCSTNSPTGVMVYPLSPSWVQD